MNHIDFKVAMGAVKHFGRNLYTTNPPAIAELVANGWDAYATKVEILADTENNAMLIIDNGIGMTDEELSKRYAVSGKPKDTIGIRKPEQLQERPIMGKKGIGKFSVFSLGNEYSMATKSTEDQSYKCISLEYTELLGENADKEQYPVKVLNIEDLSQWSVLPTMFQQKLSDFDSQSGTVIYIPDLRRHFTKQTTTALVQSLARRFAITSDNYNFSVSLNDQPLDLKNHFYNDSVQFVKYFGYDESEIKDMLKNAETWEKVDIDYLEENNVKGWVGSVIKPADLQISDESINVSGVVTYINGKLAEEDLLHSVRNVNMSTVYIVGEVNADYLQQSEEDDPVLSSRENLDLERDDVVNLRDNIRFIRDTLVAEWKHKRSKLAASKQIQLQRIFSIDPSLKEQFEGYDIERKKRVSRLVTKFFDLPDEQIDDREVKFYAPSIFQLANSEDLYSLKVDPSLDEAGQFDIIRKMFNRTEINQALHIKSTIEDRLYVIDELNKAIHENAKEKIFENHLAKNPWLINPYWDTKSGREISQQKYFNYELTDTSVKGFSDILVHISELKYPVVVEVKRSYKSSYSTPSASAIVDQVNKYRVGLIKEANIQFPELHLTSKNQIPAYVIVGPDAIKKWEEDIGIEDFKNNNIEIKTYSTLIDNAEKMYEKPFKVIEDENE